MCEQIGGGVLYRVAVYLSLVVDPVNCCNHNCTILIGMCVCMCDVGLTLYIMSITC